MHMSLEEQDPEETEKQLEQRWHLKYQYKYMYKYKARDAEQELVSHASQLLGAAFDPIDPTVLQSPQTPQPKSADPPAAPASPDIATQNADIEFAVSVEELDAMQLEQVHKQVQRQVHKLQREVNLIPLARTKDRAMLTPLLKRRKCETTGWAQILAAVQSTSVDTVKAALSEKNESVIWTGNAAWWGIYLTKKLRISSPPASPGSPSKPWNSGYTNDHQKAYDKRLAVLEDQRSAKLLEERGNSPQTIGSLQLGLTNDPPSPDLARSISEMLAAQPSAQARKSPAKTPVPMLSPHDVDRTHLLVSYYDTPSSDYLDPSQRAR